MNRGAFRIVEKDNLRGVEINEVTKMLSCKDESRGFHIPMRTTQCLARAIIDLHPKGAFLKIKFLRQ